MNRDLNEVRKQDGKMWRLAPLPTDTGRGKSKDPEGDCAWLLGEAARILGRLEQSG